MTYQENRNKGGRPKAVKGKARTKTISTRLTLAEWKAVMRRITDAGKKPSHFLRELLLYGKVVAARTQEDRQQIRMLEGGCNNLNQLAKMAHQQGFPGTKSKIMALLDEFNKETGLYHHAWDESKSQRWANPQDGTSPNFWGRSIGWWFMAMVDVLDYIPDNHPGRASLISWIQGLAESLPNYQRDGLWYQVIDQPEREGNFPEASVTTQCMYAYAKAVNKGYIDAQYRTIAEKAFNGLKQTLLLENPDGTLTLTRCCQVGGLGGTPYRDGSFEYYIGEKMRDNDAKATGPFIMGCLQLGK